MKLLFEPSRELELVVMAVAFGIGGAHDAEGRGGVASIAGRMLRRGAVGMPGEEIEERVDALGAEFGVGVGLGSTVVSAEVLTRSAGALAELIAKVLATPAFEPDELGKLKRHAEAEIVAARDDDSTLASRALRRNLYAGHPHARRIEGDIASVRAIERDEVVRCYQRGMTQANATVAIGGDLDEAEAERLAQILVSALPEGEALAYPVGEPVAPVGRRLVIVDKAERSQVKLGVGTLGTHPRDDDHHALLVATCAFGGTFTSRLTQEIRSKRGWSYGASASLGTGRVRDRFTMWTAPSTEDAAACLALQLELFEAWHEGGLAEEEVAFARDYLCRSYAFEIDTAKKRLNQKVERALLGLADDYHGRYIERIGQVTREECNRAVRRRLEPGNLWVAAVATDSEVGDALRSAMPWDETRLDRYDAE